MTPTQTDPFSLVFQSLWDIVDTSTPLTALVKEKNQIRLNKATERNPMKDAVAAADLPELVLTTTGTSFVNSHVSSCTTEVTRQYAWMLSTGDFRVSHLLFPVEFALFAALIEGEKLIKALKWKNYPFVKKCLWSGLTEGVSNPLLNRGIIGWSSLWTFQIDMHFPTADLILFNQGH